MLAVRLGQVEVSIIIALDHSPSHPVLYFWVDFRPGGSTAYMLCALDAGSCVLRGT